MAVTDNSNTPRFDKKKNKSHGGGGEQFSIDMKYWHTDNEDDKNEEYFGAS